MESPYADYEREITDLKAELEAARKAAFMPPGYPGGLANYITVEVWPMPRSCDIEKIQELNSELTELKSKYGELLDDYAAETWKRRE